MEPVFYFGYQRKVGGVLKAYRLCVGFRFFCQGCICGLECICLGTPGGGRKGGRGASFGCFRNGSVVCFKVGS